MEFPDLGQNCNEKTCKQLGMLLMNNTRCKKESRIFIISHNSDIGL